jgi:hypothetical protein
MRIHIGWVALLVIALIALWYFNPGGIVTSFGSSLGNLSASFKSKL